MDRQRRSIKSFAVIGLGFGDEGKGTTVNWLTKQLKDSLVVRYSGGQQAGHMVTLWNGTSHIFSNFGSGSLQGAPTHWSKYCSFDPVGMKREWDILVKKSESRPILYLDVASPVTTPYEKYYNKNFSKAMKHGTCGVGVGATFKREEEHVSLLVGDLQFPTVVKMKMSMIQDYYISKVGYAVATAHDLEKFEEACNFINTETNIRFTDYLKSVSHYIFEGSQGLLLDQSIGFFPHVTPSNTGTKNIREMVPNDAPYLYLVTRAYQTRHGNGPMTNEHLPNKIKDNPNDTNVQNEFQGAFRKSILDLDLLKYGIERDPYIRNTENRTLVITCLDLVGEYKYTIDGEVQECETMDEFLRGISTYLNIPEVIACSDAEGNFETFNYKVEPKYLGEFG
jgi:adenylosuccinate synthase